MHFFNTFFYKKLSQKNTDRARGDAGAGPATAAALHKPGDVAAHERIKKWTKHVDLFDKARARCDAGACTRLRV